MERRNGIYSRPASFIVTINKQRIYKSLILLHLSDKFWQLFSRSLVSFRRVFPYFAKRRERRSDLVSSCTLSLSRNRRTKKKESGVVISKISQRLANHVFAEIYFEAILHSNFEFLRGSIRNLFYLDCADKFSTFLHLNQYIFKIEINEGNELNEGATEWFRDFFNKWRHDRFQRRRHIIASSFEHRSFYNCWMDWKWVIWYASAAIDFVNTS